MRRIVFLGVWMTPDVGETVSFMIDNNEKILVDCGTNLVGGLKKNQIDPSSISSIILTHSHGDHLSGLPTFLFYRLLIATNIMGKPSEPLQIIGTESTLTAAKEYVRIVYGDLANNPAINYVAIKENGSYKSDYNEFKFFKSMHMPETVGFVTRIGGKKIVYSGDTALCDNVLSNAVNADILIHDVVGTSKYKPLSAAHTLCNEISPKLTEKGVKSFYPVHRLSIYKNNVDDYIEELKKDYSGFVIIPNDGDCIEL